MTDGLPEKEKIRQIAIYLFSFVTIIYLLSLSLPNIYSVDHYYQRYEVTRSIVEKFDISIPDSDEGVKGIDDRTYSLYGLGWSILAVPFYIAGKFIGRSPQNFVSILNLVAGAATVTLVFLFSVALGYSRRSSLIVSMFYGFGTFAWPMAKHPFDHTVETLFVLLSVYFMYLHSTKNAIIHLILSALCIGFAINTRLVSILSLPALLVMMGAGYDAKDRLAEYGKVFFRKIVIFMLVLLPFAGLVLWYNYYRFGSIFETGFQLLAAKTGIDFFSGTPFFTGLRGFLTSPGKGFFYYSPIAVFFFFAITPFFKKHCMPAIAFIVLILSYLLFLSRNKYWHGDWAWGPRYLLAITPLVILPITGLLDSVRWRKNNPFIRLPLYVVFALSLLIQISAVSVHYYNYFVKLRMDETISISAIRGAGVPMISEPPPGVYFEWKRSPILAQFRYVYEIGKGTWDNKSLQPIENKRGNFNFKSASAAGKRGEHPEIRADLEGIQALPPFWIFDLWWVYLYFLNKNYAGFIVVLAFLIGCTIYGYQMAKLSRR
jgi:hypothetical protein